MVACPQYFNIVSKVEVLPEYPAYKDIINNDYIDQ